MKWDVLNSQKYVICFPLIKYRNFGRGYLLTDFEDPPKLVEKKEAKTFTHAEANIELIKINKTNWVFDQAKIERI